MMKVFMKKPTRIILVIALLASVFLSLFAPLVAAQFYPQPGSPLSDPSQFVEPEPCASGQGDKPSSARQGSYCPNLAAACIIDPKLPADQKKTLEDRCKKESDLYATNCAKTYSEWLTDKNKNFWVEDPEITALGKGGERSRQFLLWVLTRPSIDDHPTILEVWKLSQNVALFFILIVALVMGLGIIISQRNNFNLGIEVTPLVIRLAILIIFVLFSAQIVLLIIKLSDIIMEFFIRTLGVRELFNIFFVDFAKGDVTKVSEQAYRQFIGCTNWNAENFEMVRTSKFLVKFTNMTYYFLGIMMILRKVVLWFLLIVSPFLAILAPWVFIRNIGWIWVGVFFQWVFYGPLFALFLGSLAKIWNSPSHIPYVFDFSRTHQMSQAVYPTSINILYGGPAQTLGIWNSSNYVDTFAEYVIALIMLWVVLILPWWLLRIFRDYCCDGIYAMKNILLSMYDTLRNPPGGPTPGPVPAPTGTTGLSMKLPKDVEMKARIRLETVQDIRQAKTESIVQSMNMKASNITQIARLETNQAENQEARRNLDKIQNPFKAETPTERQKLMNVRDEIQSRAVRGDQEAKNFASVTSKSVAQQQASKQRILQSMPRMVPVIQNIAIKFSLPKEKTRDIISKIFSNIAFDQHMVQTISQESHLTPAKTQQVLQTVSTPDLIDGPSVELVQKTAEATGLKVEQVKMVIAKTAVIVRTNPAVSQQVAQSEQVEQETVKNVAQAQLEVTTAPERHMEQHIPASKKVSIEDYEEVKKMWISQYEKGEIPVTENITTRTQWVEQDVVKISNLLNKIMSSDIKMQEQGLDEIGFILPIFMINNLSGEELLVYLKAKIEAAKQVQRDQQKEAEIRAKVSSEEEFVDIEAPKQQEAAKAQTLQQELTIDGQENEKKAEENQAGGSAEQYMRNEQPEAQAPLDPAVEDIQKKLEEVSEPKPTDQ